MKNKIKLLHCPFCGGSATVKVYDFGKGYEVFCNKVSTCNAGTAPWENKLDAINAWNNRAEKD